MIIPIRSAHCHFSYLVVFKNYISNCILGLSFLLFYKISSSNKTKHRLHKTQIIFTRVLYYAGVYVNNTDIVAVVYI